ncbi:ImmA/IrrE family metallo-endopeptidase [Prosthecobacter algae]|uniref:ImmA/IrrE family metallo-endopeptidase n=1 Tax=Prosthecobacter algae TaxID=1144682 RepID=A0ABP9PH49_9BACT
MSTNFQPDYASPPGETLAETLDAMGLTQSELARRMGRPIKTINEIIQAKAALTADTALELERVLGVPAHFWMNLETQYRELLARQRAADRLEVDEEWLASLPVMAMQKLGWLSRTKDKKQIMVELLNFFGCANVKGWKEVWSGPVAAFRKSPKLQSDPEAVAAWLRKAELEARKQPCAPYDEAAFLKALQKLRGATTLPVRQWVSTIQQACNECGVAYVLLPELQGTHVSGAARQLTDSTALIVQTGRYKDDGHFWFTFFHEAKHVLQGKLKREWLVEYEGREDALEVDANQFAREFLIPTERIAAVRASHGGKLPVAAGKALAKQLGISEGIVAGRLQFDRIWMRFVGNELKRRYDVSDLLTSEAAAI